MIRGRARLLYIVTVSPWVGAHRPQNNGRQSVAWWCGRRPCNARRLQSPGEGLALQRQ